MTLIEENAKYFARKKENNTYINEIQNISNFLSNLGFLSFGRDYIQCDKWMFSLQRVITSLELTTGNIINCCKSACLADANTLLRKYRDDMFFYLYLSLYNHELLCEQPVEHMKEHIVKWINNELSGININFILKSISLSTCLKNAVAKYNLKETFSKIGKRLNNYVHGNGYIYYNQNILSYSEKELENILQTLVDDIKYITITFVFLLFLCSPSSFMSNDYIDYLEFNETPIEGSQYWIAPFAEKFIKDNLELIDDNCYQYLKDNTSMDL